VTLGGSKSDRHGRLIAKVIVEGTEANLEQVKAGLAWHFKRYEREQSPADRNLYAAAEFKARIDKINIWSKHDPVAPWDFRIQKK
jgi:endonuclease YncB( thermonuclease family)